MPTRIPVVATALLLIAGCGAPQPALHPVSGTVARNGTPLAGGGLIFLPESGVWGGRVVNASVNPDGTFSVNTSTSRGGNTEIQPGAPAGRYKVHYHPPGDGQKVGLEVELPEVITVEPKENVLTLDVPEKKSSPKKDEPTIDRPADKPTGDK